MASLTFTDFGFSPTVLASITQKGFEEPTTIQILAIPRLMEGTAHLLAKARTGTGKTAAFGLPLVDKLCTPSPKVRALVLVPTRELAIQVSAEIASFCSGPAPRLATIYGGASMGEQLRRLARGVDLVIGTPGRVLDHIDRKTLDLSGLEWLVLDEADEMLDMGFIEDIERVMDASNPDRRVVLFSATMPDAIMRIARNRLGEFERVEDETNPVQAGLTDQIWLEVRERDKLEALCRIVDSEDEFYGLVFCHTKIETDGVARALSERGYAAEALHGDVSQDMRERTLGRFRERKTLILVATDVAARGIDVERLTHVVNFNLPFDPESYTHRIGRTGRAGNKGTAITFVTPEENRRLFFLRRASGDGLRKGSIPSVSEVIEAKRARIHTKTIAVATEVLGLPPVRDDELEEYERDIEADRVLEDTDAQATQSLSEFVDDAAPVDAAMSIPAQNAAKSSAPMHASAFYELADELLGELDPRDALAALAAAAFASDLDPRSYGEVRDVSVDATGIARLYVGLGKSDGIWPRDIAEAIKRLTGLPDRFINDIEVLEKFSFASIPFEAAERAIIEAKKHRGAPFVRIATPKSGPSGGGRPGRPAYGSPKSGGRPYGRGGSSFRSGKPDGERPMRKPGRPR
ncbi:MAG: DEAD/DEAH box helicase [Spirochaetales bacterium]|nr:MAG: DEAD/DEAH box helicase [Spirochaetales bacterium]